MHKFHLKGLDTYRGIAALVVLLGHIEFQKLRFGIDNLMEHAFYKYTGGHTGVILFFVLSGFLITLLLLNEKEEFKTITLRDFYLRRMFRVWPLYYFIIAISYFLLDYSPSGLTIVLCLTIFPNVAHAMEINWSGSPQIWSIGVEEQFYLFWPLVIKKSKNVVLSMVVIFLFFTFLPNLVARGFYHVTVSEGFKTAVTNFLYGAKFNCMAIGGLTAVAFKKSQFIAFINRYLFLVYFLIILPFALWFCGFHTIMLNDEFYAILFAVSILLITTNHAIINPDRRVTIFLGKISYGIYMYHWLVLELLLKYKLAGNGQEDLFNLKLYVLTIGVTLIVAYLSYRFLEKPFLKIKEKYNRHPEALKSS